MIPRLPLLAVAGALALAGPARAEDVTPADAYLAVTGLAPGASSPPASILA